MERKKLETLGIWIGSPAKLPSLRREGIFRFLYQLLKHLGANPTLKFEVWCQQINLPRVQELLSPLLETAELRERVAFCTEMHVPGRPGAADGRVGPPWLRAAAAGAHGLRTAIYFFRGLPPRVAAGLAVAALLLVVAATLLLASPAAVGRLLPWGGLLLFALFPWFVLPRFRSLSEGFLTGAWDTFKSATNLLPRVANRFSAADCFLIQNIDMDNALHLDRLKFVNLHDLFAAEFAPLFRNSGRDRRLLYQGRKAVRSAAALARQGAFFISNSEHICRTHALALIPGLRPERTAVVFLPAIVPEGIIRQLRGRQEIMTAFSIPTEYLFYPTHIRPYKNILTLLKALKAVLERGHEISLALTGSLADDAESSAFARREGLMDRIVLCGEVSEPDMYSLYRHAALAVVPTLAESSFPWQALEALAMETPVIVSRIPVVEERLRSEGLTEASGGVLWFDPRDENELARRIVHVLADRDRAVSGQKKLRDTLLAYDWPQLADRYVRIFSGCGAGET